MITQSEIKELQELQDGTEMLKTKLKMEEEKCKTKEKDLIIRVSGGEQIDFGPLSLNIRTEKRRTPAWKQVFIEHLGEEKANTILVNTKEKIFNYLEVIRNLSYCENTPKIRKK